MILGLRYSPTRITGNSQIPALIEEAYALKWFQIQLPDGDDIRMNTYAISAVFPASTRKDTVRLMFRTMLRERFGLRFHRETKEIPVYVLTAPRGKVKLEAVDIETARQRELDTPMGRRKGAQSASGPGWYAAGYTTMDEFAGQIGMRLDRPVINQSGLTGTYSIQLRWDPADEMDLISAIQRQLGLKVENRTMPYEMFVVDHVELVPTPN